MSYTDDINPQNYHGCALKLPTDDKRHPMLQQQRRERGFDDSETWSLYSAILKFTLPRLKRFREITKSFPMDTTAEGWDRELAEMIFAIETCVTDDCWDIPRTPEEEARRDRVEAGMKLFHERFLDLWS